MPFLPKVIGVVTSPTGAVIRDILHRISERYPLHVLVWPVLVQGDKAAQQISAAIDGFNALEVGGKVPRPDVLIVARGGGSLEDLWPFNEEIVVRAVANSQIPVISAVGHETDTTLIDYVSDLRAPTPTAAAEKAVPVKADLLLFVEDLGQRGRKAIFRYLEVMGNELRGLARGLPKPAQILDEKTQRLDNLSLRMANAFPKIIKDKQQQLHFVSKLMESYHYKKVLERGFVLVRSNKGKLVTSAADVSSGNVLEIEFHDGKKDVVADGFKPKGGKIKDSGKQDSLF